MQEMSSVAYANENILMSIFCSTWFVYMLQVADWFALMNDKMGGDLAKIKDVGRYFVEVHEQMDGHKFWSGRENDTYHALMDHLRPGIEVVLGHGLFLIINSCFEDHLDFTFLLLLHCRCGKPREWTCRKWSFGGLPRTSPSRPLPIGRRCSTLPVGLRSPGSPSAAPSWAAPRAT